MIKLRNAVLAMAMGLLATGALAQHFTQDSQAATVAEELFGSGSVKLEFNDFGDADDAFVPKAKLIFGGAETITNETEFSVTFTLSNATFAEPVSNSDFMWGSWGPDDNGADDISGNADDNQSLVFTPLPAEVTLERSDGGKNTNSVSFKVTVEADTPIAGLMTPTLGTDPVEYAGETRKIVFVLPDVNASGLLAANAMVPTLVNGVDVTVTPAISQPKSGGTVIMESVMNGHLCGVTPLAKAPATVGCPVVEAVAVITSIANTAGGGLISLAPTDERSVLVGGNGKASDPQRAWLSTVQVAIAEGFGGARDQDGDVIDDFTGDLAGTLAIRVSSDSFGEDDVVYIDSNANGKVDGREAFEMDNGVASDTVPLVSSPLSLFYVPSGDEPLKHRTSFTTTANTEFADATAKLRSAKAATAQLKLHGIKDGVAKAYAIAPVSSTDMANVRVTCETSAKTGCNVFLDCKDQMGMNTFGEAGIDVGPGMTARWSQMDIAMALGLEDGWDGRMACDVLSSAPITVQVLTRAAGVWSTTRRSASAATSPGSRPGPTERGPAPRKRGRAFSFLGPAGNSLQKSLARLPHRVRISSVLLRWNAAAMAAPPGELGWKQAKQANGDRDDQTEECSPGDGHGPAGDGRAGPALHAGQPGGDGGRGTVRQRLGEAGVQ